MQPQLLIKNKTSSTICSLCLLPVCVYVCVCWLGEFTVCRGAGQSELRWVNQDHAEITCKNYSQAKRLVSNRALDPVTCGVDFKNLKCFSRTENDAAMFGGENILLYRCRSEWLISVYKFRLDFHVYIFFYKLFIPLWTENRSLCQQALFWCILVSPYFFCPLHLKARDILNTIFLTNHRIKCGCGCDVVILDAPLPWLTFIHCFKISSFVSTIESDMGKFFFLHFGAWGLSSYPFYPFLIIGSTVVKFHRKHLLQ